MPRKASGRTTQVIRIPSEFKPRIEECVKRLGEGQTIVFVPVEYEVSVNDYLQALKLGKVVDALEEARKLIHTIDSFSRECSDIVAQAKQLDEAAGEVRTHLAQAIERIQSQRPPASP